MAGGCLLSACGTDGGCVSLLAVEQMSAVLESGGERSPLRSVQRRLDMRVLSRVRSVHVKLEDPVPLCLGNLTV